MEKLIEIKAEKETYMNELEKLRLDVLKEKSVLESLKQHNITLLDNEIPQFLCKSKNDVSDLSQNLPPLVLQPASLQRQINLHCCRGCGCVFFFEQYSAQWGTLITVLSADVSLSTQV